MKAEKYILAIDHGTSGIKTSLISVHGRVLDFEFKKTPIHFLPGGGAEQDPEDWWGALLSTSRALVQRNRELSGDIEAVCISSTFSSTVAVDKDGHHLGNSLTWMDSRGAPYIKKLFGGFPNIQGYSLFKLLKWLPRTAGCPSLSGKDDIAHVLLWKHEFPEVYQKAFMFLPSKDYLNLRLTGQFAASFDSIHLFWVTDSRDINNIHYDDELIRPTGIDKEKLPPLRASTATLGTLKADVAREVGLGDDVKVIMGSPDHQSACIGSGAVRDYEGHLYIGTSSWIECIVPFKRTDVLHAVASFPTAISGKYQCLNEQDLAGGCLNFLIENLLFHKCPALPDREMPERVYDALNETAEGVPAGSNGLIFTPWLNGERTPVDDISLRGGFHNISTTTTMDHFIRAVMEGVAYNTRWSFQYVEKFIRRKMKSLNMIGGGAKSPLWCQIFADVLDCEIRQVEHPMQANARGAAYIASAGLGYITFDDIPNLTPIEKTYVPNPENRRTYAELYDSFLRIHRKNKGIYKRLNNVKTAAKD